MYSNACKFCPNNNCYGKTYLFDTLENQIILQIDLNELIIISNYLNKKNTPIKQELKYKYDEKPKKNTSMLIEYKRNNYLTKKNNWS
jgi:hypothetical protein